MNEIPSYNVSELTFLIKNTLEDNFSVVRIKGEISNFRAAASGHCYFNLKDRDSVISAVIFRQQRNQLNFIPADGQAVTVLGRITVYPQRGNYQVICESMEKTGRGDLLYQIEVLKKQLESEGLFAPEKKRSLPTYPETIAVVSSARSAAVQDIIQVLKRRMKSFRLLIFDVYVQGDLSAPSIVKALNTVYERSDIDLIILARGGGSIEDLISFSDERVVRTVAASPVPLISGVGHEIDFTLTDFASDMRAPTPSAAAELASAKSFELSLRFQQGKDKLAAAIKYALDKQSWRHQNLSISQMRDILLTRISRKQQGLDYWNMEMTSCMQEILGQYRHELKSFQADILANSSEEILKKGYALVHLNQVIIKQSSDLNAGDLIKIQFSDGIKTAIVQENNDEI